MDNDLSVKWSLANPLTIQMDDAGDVWYAGAARDVLARGPSSVLVASDTGGLWIATSGGNALPVGDFDRPDFDCLAPGVYSAEHIYAGGAGLYETDVSQIFPILTWREIPITYTAVVPNRFGIPISVTLGVSTVYRIGVTPHPRRIVVATPDGVFWSDIPPASSPYAGGYSWKKALNLPDTNLGYLGLAIGAPTNGETDFNIAVASWGTDDEAMQFYWGEWEKGELVMRKASLSDALGVIANTARATSIASCAADPRQMYAITSDKNGFAQIMFRSRDAGRSWDAFAPNLVYPKPNKGFADGAGNQGNDWGRWCQSIAVSPSNPKLIAVGWRYGGFFISEDAGKTWRRTDDSLHAHSDIHGVYFDPTDPAGEQLYFVSDGGVVAAPGLGRDAKQFISLFNRELATLQFQSHPSRMFYGSFSASTRDAGVIAGGLQDSGCVSAVLQPPLGPWLQFDNGGDGFITDFLRTGHALWNDNGEPIPNAGSLVRHSEWDSAKREFINNAVVPISVDDPQMPFPAGPPEPIVSAVTAPQWRNGQGQLMYAVAGKRSSLYGFLCDPNGDRRHWQFLAHFPLNDHLTPKNIKDKNYEPWSISAVGSRDGQTIYVGTTGGRLILYRQGQPVADEITVPVRKNPWGDDGAAVHRIVVASERLAYAAYNIRQSRATSSLYKVWHEGYVLRIRPPKAEALTPLPSAAFYGLELTHEPERNSLFAASDDRVYVSHDAGDALGDTWFVASQGLPRRPHCGDLSFVAQADGARWLYLSTYGRSVWRARL